MNEFYHPPLPNIEDRIKRLGDPRGKTMREIVSVIGYPQSELMTVSCVVEDFCLRLDSRRRALCFNVRHKFSLPRL